VIVWEYIAQNGPVCVKSGHLDFKRGFMVGGFRGKKKVQKKGVFWGVPNGGSIAKWVITPSKQRKNLFFRVYRGFFLPGNRLRVVSRAKKIFFRGKPPNF
jgi:hypothetical protein